MHAEDQWYGNRRMVTQLIGNLAPGLAVLQVSVRCLNSLRAPPSRDEANERDARLSLVEDELAAVMQ